jgi:hypothetical protein
MRNDQQKPIVVATKERKIIQLKDLLKCTS